MEIRDAREADAKRLAALADASAERMRNLIHDRTVRVADDGEVVGFVSFDARHDGVHVIRCEGLSAVVGRLLDEPARFAAKEGLAVEFVVERSREDLVSAATNAGFERVGEGPRFDGSPTVRLRREP